MMTKEDLYNEGYYFYYGKESHPLDYDKAYEYFVQAADLGYAPAMNYLGLMFENGKSVSRNIEMAFEWYCKAAEQKDESALCNLLRFYQNGIYVQADERKAFEICQELYRLYKNPTAAFTIGLAYLDRKDYQNAFNCFKLSAEKNNDPNAWYNCGYVLDVADKRNITNGRSLFFYYKAAVLGNVEAMYVFGVRQYKTNKKEGLMWVQKAADKGHKQAKMFLGVAFIANL